jgi:uncharacterized protein
MVKLDPIKVTQNWVKQVVVGLNFCPFAKREVERQSIRYHLCLNTETKSALQTVMDEVFLLDKDPGIETTLIIVTEFLDDFNDYLDFIDLASSLLGQSGYEGIYQLATFHPDYCFEGEDAGDASNYTNRSPYPTIHLLRESSLERVLKTHTSADSIPVRNIGYSREMGNEALQLLLKSCFTERA